MLQLYLDRDYNICELGEAFGISRQRVQQILSKCPEYKLRREWRPRQNEKNRELLSQLRQEHSDSAGVEERYWRHVCAKARTHPDECWEWTGNINPVTDYGRFNSTILEREYGEFDSAHRQSWCMYHGRRIPEGMWVLHTCDNPTCVNPHHLYLGTPAENVKDRQERSGWKDYTRKLSDKEVSEIRYTYDRRGIACIDEIAERFGISKPYAYSIGLRLDPRRK